MSAKGYLGPEGVARLMRKGYYSPNGVARKLVKAYCSPDGVARLAWEAGGRVRAYLYNGAGPMPELPEGSGGYTHLVIGLVNGEYRLYCNSDAHYAGPEGKISVSFSLEKEYQLIDGNWVETSEGSFFITPVWANYDIYYQTGDALGDLAGTLLLAASEPQPVYI